MYKDYYHFKENPFNITADPDFFYKSSRHKEALAHLIYGINQRKGIVVLTGEIGTGKTTLLRTVLNALDASTKTAFILNPAFSEVQLLRLILKDLGIESTAKNKVALVERLNGFLLAETSQGHNVVLIIDEAQNLGVKQLEQVRLLSNLETEKEKLLQIVLVGQPELMAKLKLESLRQINQRVSVRYHLTPLDKAEMQAYIQHRMQVAKGGKDNHPVTFTPEAVDKIYEISGGTPRMVNILCDRALLAGFSLETHTLDKEIIESSAQEVAP